MYKANKGVVVVVVCCRQKHKKATTNILIELHVRDNPYCWQSLCAGG